MTTVAALGIGKLIGYIIIVIHQWMHRNCTPKIKFAEIQPFNPIVFFDKSFIENLKLGE